ncbi:MAG TPA: hypothetical protein VF916_00715 [Ktedonobacterales bacterium]
MVDIARARAFVAANGSEADVARLRWLLDGAAPEPAIVERARAGQRANLARALLLPCPQSTNRCQSLKDPG